MERIGSLMREWIKILLGVSLFFCLNFEVSASQIIEVKEESPESFKAEVYAWEKDSSGQYNLVMGPIGAVIGRNGFASPGEKREGDGKTPSGTYPIGLSFGYNPSVETSLEYRQAGEDDFWVDDPESPQYNRWVSGLPQAKSFERLKRDDSLYEAAVVIEYNTDPVVPGHGSAIFLHIYRGPDSPTAGCVAVAKEDLYKLLSWLDKNQKPVILLNYSKQ